MYHWILWTALPRWRDWPILTEITEFMLLRRFDWLLLDSQWTKSAVYFISEGSTPPHVSVKLTFARAVTWQHTWLCDIDKNNLQKLRNYTLMDFKFNYNPILKIDEVCKEGTGKVIVLQLIGIVVMKQNRPPSQLVDSICLAYISPSFWNLCVVLWIIGTSMAFQINYTPQQNLNMYCKNWKVQFIVLQLCCNKEYFLSPTAIWIYGLEAEPWSL